MQYELRTQVIEPVRRTFDHVAKRNGDRPASRYEEGTFDLQAKENYHFRPTWSPDKEIYDPDFSVLKLDDPYVFTDPRQYYYAPYVTNRAQEFESFGTTLGYVESRDLLGRLPEGWQKLLKEAVVPLRHYESGAQMVSCETARFGWGTTITQCAAYASFDRVGNAQLLSRIGIAMGGGTAELLAEAKEDWLEADHLQPLRRRMEELMVERDWGVSLVGLDVCDTLLYRVLFNALDDEALVGGAGAYSLLSQHFAGWFTDQRKWLDKLYATWLADPVHGSSNAEHLERIGSEALASATLAVQTIVDKISAWTGVDARQALEAAAEETRKNWGGQ